jgi:ubiquinone/menaquinone biosynthesis C-methylase UbiE
MKGSAMTTPNFDRIARAYRWLEYLTLGPLLERTRNHHIPRLARCRRALILGDGDGRFTARLLAENPDVEVDAVDTSRRMLECLSSRSAASSRVRTHQADARSFTPGHSADLIVTHFFLDCLTQAEVDALVARFAASGTLWLVSDFRIPAGLLHWPARIYVRMLYFAFRILTGLRVTRIPDYALALRANGFVPVEICHRLFGVLTTELWAFGEKPAR